ncbi:Fe-S cluster assembly sulfur transfer protein SufU [Haploplasma modicum]|uniref:Fe-S cluster assembly sulfur transfer protein SufU n=1 Tax=Haploplasma modicum TaxID=2150 RepID=UPI00214C42A0|nr:SUF system NifU family Fe-S cluster assembly protein [Haploplasma modicum]MCR1809380.1 SUF system NifU family Fe-S cluster assembly protein [Haploplasma modicum]
MDFSNLYRDIIMDHYKYPHNKGLVDDSTYLTIHVNNPSCGDDVVIQLKVEDNVIKDIRQLGTGCSICCSSASIMTNTLKNLNKDDSLKIINEFYNLVMGKEYNKDILKGDALAYSTVSKFPARVKCASLAWKAIEKGLLNEEV